MRLFSHAYLTVEINQLGIQFNASIDEVIPYLTTSIMRNLLFTFLFALLSFGANAQVDGKLNIGSFILGGIDVSADIALSESSSIAPTIGFASYDFGSDDFKYNILRFVPEYRHYLNPEKGADRFFVGGYGKLSFLTAKNESNNSETNTTRGALGVLFGNKWVADSGFVFELNMGLGRATIFDKNDGDNDEFDRAFSTLTSLDLRIGIIAGYRF